MAASIRLKGGLELQRDFSRLEAGVRGDVLAKAALAGALVVEADAKAKVPRVSTTLMRSIHSEVVKQDADSAAVAIGTNVEYAPYVEFGTGVHGPKGAEIVYRRKTRVIRKTRGGGRFVLIHDRTIRHPGMKPKPYLMPAFEAKSEQAGKDIAEAVWKQVKEIAKQ